MTDLGFDNKVAVITGAGNGLGRAHALEFARRGARVVVNDLGGSVDGSGTGSAGPAQQVVDEIVALGGEAVASTASVATPEGGNAIVRTAIDAFGRVDILVNNAGILRDKSFHNMTVDQIDAVIDVHLRGSFYVTHAAWGHMREQAYGRIINTSSNSGILGNFGQSNYGAAKMGLVGMMNVLALEGAKHNIKVNSIAPLAFTRMTADLMPGFEEKIRPEMVTPVVIYLAHDSCEVTGEIYSVGGGTVSRFFIGLTPGYAHPALTAEDVRDNLGAIRDEAGYVVLHNNGQELKKIFTMLS